MSDYFLWNGDPVIFSRGSLHLYWYAVLIILAFLASLFFLKDLWNTKSKNSSGLSVITSRKQEYLVLFILLISLCFSRWGYVLISPSKGSQLDLLTNILPISFKPSMHFIGLNHLSMAFGILGIILATWVFNKLVFKGNDFLYLLDRIAVVVCFSGTLLFAADFIHSDYLGRPTDATWGTVFARPITDGLSKLKCCIMRNPDGPNPLAQILLKKGESKQSKAVGQKNIVYTLIFKQGIEEREANEFIIGDVKTYLYEHPLYVQETGTEPIKYALSKLPAGNISATVSTIGIARHPIQIYLGLVCLLLFIWFYSNLKRASDARTNGFVSGCILFGFSFFYFVFANWLNYTNGDAQYLGLSIHQWLIIPLSLLGLFLIIGSLRRSKLNG